MTSKATTSVHTLARQLSDMDINGKSARTNLQKQPSQTKLLSKFAPSQVQPGEKTAPMSAAVRMALAGAHAAVSKSLTTKNAASRPPSPGRGLTKLNIDIGSYDGGFELENEKRGSKVYGEAAEELALDSSLSRYVSCSLYP